MRIGHAIKKCRQLKNITLLSLANKTGLSKSYLSLVESEKRQIPLDTLKKVSEVLNVSIYLLIYLAAEDDEIKEIDKSLKIDLDRLILDLVKKDGND